MITLLTLLALITPLALLTLITLKEMGRGVEEERIEIINEKKNLEKEGGIREG